MFISRDKCHYDSGDRSTNEELARKVIQDGDEMYKVPSRTLDGQPYTHWYIKCPQGHDGDEIHLD